MTNVDDVLEHHGIKGMKWGVRKAEDSSTGNLKAVLPGPKIDPSLHPTTKAAAGKVSKLINDRYGFEIGEVKVLGKDHPEYPTTAAYVAKNTGPAGAKGILFVQARNLNPLLKNAETAGWFGKDCGTITGLVTHESAHALFHADQKVVRGIFVNKMTGGNMEARTKALQEAYTAAKQDGIHPFDLPGHISGYAKAANVREEVEAELFTQYHWQKNPPRFVKVWGETLHAELGLDPTPFRKGAKHV